MAFIEVAMVTCLMAVLERQAAKLKFKMDKKEFGRDQHHPFILQEADWHVSPPNWAKVESENVVSAKIESAMSRSMSRWVRCGCLGLHAARMWWLSVLFETLFPKLWTGPASSLIAICAIPGLPEHG